MTRGVWYGALVASLLSACDDAVLRAFESSTSALGGMGGLGSSGDAGRGRGGARSSDAGAGAGAVAGASAVAGAGAAGAAASLVIDDFEDGDTRAKEPFGWWYPVNDATGTQGFGIAGLGRHRSSSRWSVCCHPFG